MPTRKRLRPKDLKFSKNMRTSELDESLLLELAESMRVRQLQPIVVAPDYTVIVGNRRGRAALVGNLEFVDADVLDEMPTETTSLMYQWAENFFREGITDWDKYQTCDKLFQLMPAWKGKDVAEFLKCDASMIARFMCPSKGTEAVRDALRTGRICLASCYEITKYPRDQQQGVLDMALNGGSRSEVIQLRRGRNRRANGSSRKLQVVTLPFLSGMTVTVRGPKVGMEELNQAMVDIQRELRHARDKLHIDDAKDFERALRRKLKRGTVTEATYA